MNKYLILAVVLFSCNTTSRQKAETHSREILDSIANERPVLAATPFIFERAFSGTSYHLKDSAVKLYGVNIGNLKVSSGKIIACDPLHVEEYGIPFTQQFPVGEFPVQLAIAQVGLEEMIAFMRVKFSNKPVVKWEFALQKGQQPLPIGGSEIHGYGVDAARGIMMDVEARKHLNAEKLTSMNDTLYQEMDKHIHNGWRYALYNFGDYNLAAFTTGFGDGRYATYIGFDIEGKPCRLLTDFDFFDWKKK
ncbi:MAG: DUF4241 domain-containing protein [Chitinophagaceae bacterium]|nr:MAG: DUF4241 domain-containing protein [Chitinophagaceae bacterium]